MRGVFCVYGSCFTSSTNFGLPMQSKSTRNVTVGTTKTSSATRSSTWFVLGEVNQPENLHSQQMRAM